ncbi:MAG: hypothetical protein EXR80_07365 [Methylococcales bacterium]|nr:hypothetical protein [Methylococcales bacterium]
MDFLDVRTIFIICIGFIFIYGIGMLACARKVSASFSGIYLFAVINFLLAIGILLGSLRESIDIAWSIVVANSVIMLAVNIMYHAHLQFIGAEKKPMFLSVISLV